MTGATAPAQPSTPIRPAGASRAPALLAFAVLVAAVIGRFAFTLWEPPFDGTIRYDDVAALGGAYWPMNLYLGGPAWALSFLVPAVFVALLGRGRSAPLTLAAAPVIACGGLVFALAITAETLPFAYAASAHVFPEATGRGIVDTLNGHFDWLLPAIIGASLAVGAGFLLALIGGLLARTLPRWFGIAGIAYIAVFVFSPLEQLVPEVAFAGQLLQYALLLGIAWFGLRASRREPTGGGDEETPGIARG